MEYTLLIFAWCLWCLLHSALISLTVTNYLKEKLGGKYKFYRLAYNLFALATLIPLILYESILRSQPIFRWDGMLLIVRMLLLGTAGGLFLSGALKFDMLHFLGIRQIGVRI